MSSDIRIIWRTLRPTIKKSCTFSKIKDIVASATLPVENLSHLQQRSLPAKGNSKGELLDAIDELISKEKNQSVAMKMLIESFIKMKPDQNVIISQSIKEHGWVIKDNKLHSI